MRTLLSRYPLSIGVAAMLAGCGRSQSPIGAPGGMPQTALSAPARTAALRTLTTSSYQVLFRFGERCTAPRNTALRGVTGEPSTA